MGINISPTTSSPAALLEAIRKLDALSCPKKIKTSSSLISRVKSFVCSFWGQEEPDVEMEAIDAIIRARFHINLLAQGNPEEKKLANFCVHVINKYNDQHQEHRGLPKIDLLRPWTVKRCYYSDPEQETKQGAVCVISTIKQAAVAALLPKSVDLFRMKGLTLLKHVGIDSNPEVRATVMHSPIVITGHEGARCMLQQRLNLFPGQTVVVTGEAAFDVKTKAIGLPDPKSFFIFLESTQTGFPHPVQRSGWALGSQLLPEYPQRIDLLQQTSRFFDMKRELAAGLLSEGQLIKKAKNVLKLKQQTFQAHKQELVALHRLLAQAIIEASPHADRPENAFLVIERYYDLLMRCPKAFDCLSDTYQEICHWSIAQPHQVLLKAIIQGKSTDLGSGNAVDRACAAQKILYQAFEQACQEVTNNKAIEADPDRRIALDYIDCMGSVIGAAAKPIILQYLSEDLVFYPPRLTLFQQKIQAAAYQQVKDFFAELSAAKIDYKIIHQQLEQDIDLFRHGRDLTVARELSSYFQERYSNLSVI